MTTIRGSEASRDIVTASASPESNRVHRSFPSRCLTGDPSSSSNSPSPGASQPTTSSSAGVDKRDSKWQFQSEEDHGSATACGAAATTEEVEEDGVFIAEAAYSSLGSSCVETPSEADENLFLAEATFSPFGSDFVETPDEADEDVFLTEAASSHLRLDMGTSTVNVSSKDDPAEDLRTTRDENYLPLPFTDDASASAALGSKYKSNTLNDDPSSTTPEVSAPRKAFNTTSNDHRTAEIGVLQKALALVIRQRDTAIAQSRAKTSLVRDLLAVVHLDEPERAPEDTATHRKSGFGWMNKKRGKLPTQSWYGGWLLGKCEAIKGPETTWAVKSSPVEALHQLDNMIALFEGRNSSTPEILIEAKALKAVILRSLDKPDEALLYFDKALDDCFNFNLTALSRKIQFLRGQCFSDAGTFAQASFCFKLAEGVEECYEEMRARHKKFADEKMSEAVDQVDAQGLLKS